MSIPKYIVVPSSPLPNENEASLSIFPTKKKFVSENKLKKIQSLEMNRKLSRWTVDESSNSNCNAVWISANANKPLRKGRRAISYNPESGKIVSRGYQSQLIFSSNNEFDKNTRQFSRWGESQASLVSQISTCEKDTQNVSIKQLSRWGENQPAPLSPTATYAKDLKQRSMSAPQMPLPSHQRT